jgi:hypothetical protein
MNGETLRTIALQEMWFDALVHGEGRNSISKTIDALPSLSRDEVIDAIHCDITGGRCKATNRQQFIRWLVSRIETHAKRLAPFELEAEIKRKNGGGFKMADVRTVLFTYGLTETKTPFPPYTVRDGVAEI